jgi:hypothetical protein
MEYQQTTKLETATALLQISARNLKMVQSYSICFDEADEFNEGLEKAIAKVENCLEQLFQLQTGIEQLSESIFSDNKQK